MVEIQFILMLSVALYYIFKPSIKRIDFVVDGEKVPLDGLDHYRGLLRLHRIALSPEVVTDAYYKQRFKIINNYQPDDVSLGELEEQRNIYCTGVCLKDVQINLSCARG